MQNLIGKRYGSWLVLNDTEDKRKVHCRCDCGTEKDVWRTNLTCGYSSSCGCVPHAKMIERCTKHGGTRTRLYTVWSNMRRRCYEPQNKRYARYGGRGITVCDEWKDDFGAFRDWMLAQGYDETSPYGKQTLDRIDNDGDYSPDNCRIVDIKKQNSNRCTRHLLEYNGFSMSITEWNNKMGYPDGCIDKRIRRGWSVERAITTPPKRRV